jgi:hypothetical protein
MEDLCHITDTKVVSGQKWKRRNIPDLIDVQIATFHPLVGP